MLFVLADPATDPPRRTVARALLSEGCRGRGCTFFLVFCSFPPDVFFCHASLWQPSTLDNKARTVVGDERVNWVFVRGIISLISLTYLTVARLPLMLPGDIEFPSSRNGSAFECPRCSLLRMKGFHLPDGKDQKMRRALL